jgi:hypothetical protein
VTTESSFLWDVTPCRLAEVCWHSGAMYCLDLRSWHASQASCQCHIPEDSTVLQTCFILSWVRSLPPLFCPCTSPAFESVCLQV